MFGLHENAINIKCYQIHLLSSEIDNLKYSNLIHWINLSSLSGCLKLRVVDFNVQKCTYLNSH